MNTVKRARQLREGRASKTVKSLVIFLTIAGVMSSVPLVGLAQGNREAEIKVISAAMRDPTHLSSINALINLLSSDDKGVSQFSADVLSRIGLPTVNPLLRAWAQRGEPLDLDVVWILSTIGSGVVGGDAAETFVGNRLEQLRLNYFQAKQGERSGRTNLVRMLEDRTGSISIMASVALADVGPSALNDLVAALASPKPGVAADASFGLVLMGELSVPSLRKAARSPNKLTRYFAIQSLATIIDSKDMNSFDFDRLPIRGYGQDTVKGFLNDPDLRSATLEFMRWKKDPSSLTADIDKNGSPSPRKR